MAKIPIVYAFVYYKLKENTRTEHLTKEYIKEVIARVLVRHAGFPKIFIKYVIDDLVRMNLLERVNNHYYILKKDDCYKNISKMFPFYN